MKKLLLGLGTTAIIAIPILAVVSCGDNNTKPPKKKEHVAPTTKTVLQTTGVNVENHGTVPSQVPVDTSGHTSNHEQTTPAKVTIDNSGDRTKSGQSSLTLADFKIKWSSIRTSENLGLQPSLISHMPGTTLILSSISYAGANPVITYILAPLDSRANIVKYKTGTLTITGFAPPVAVVKTEIDNSQDALQTIASNLQTQVLQGNLGIPSVTIGILRLVSALVIHADVNVEYMKFTWKVDHVEVMLKFTPARPLANTLKITSGILNITPSKS